MKQTEQDARLSRSLKAGTDGAARREEEVRRALWRSIDAAHEERKIDMRKTRSLLIKLAGAAVAVAAVAVFFTLTPPGNALAENIVKFFAPEKEVVIDIEGDKEKQDAVLEKNTDSTVGYVIYIDGERYYRQSVDGADYIKVKEPADYLPPVYMEIRQLEGQSPQAVFEQLRAKAQSEFPELIDLGQVTDPIDGWGYVAYDPSAGDTPHETLYVVDNTAGGSFVIRLRMFLEASEGHGARFHAMLKTFEIVPSAQLQP